MAGKISKTMFQSGPLDDLLTVDVYKVSDTAPKNSLLDSLNNFGYKAAETIRDNPKMFDQIKDTVKGLKGGNLSKVEALERVSEALGNGTLKALTSGLQSGLVSTMQTMGASKETVSNVLVAFKDTTRLLSSADLENMRGVAQLMEGIGGNEELIKVFDLAAEAALFNTVMGNLINLGLPELIDDLAAKASDRSVVENSYRNNLPAAVQQSDLYTLGKLSDYLTVPGTLSIMPDVVNQVLTHYQIPPGTPEENYPNLLTELTAILTKLDPNWSTVSRGGDRLPNLAPFTAASPDALKILGQSETYRLQTQTAKNFPIVDLIQLGKQFYPMAAL